MFEPTDEQHFTRQLLMDERICGFTLSHVERTEMLEPYRQLCIHRGSRVGARMPYPSTATCLAALIDSPWLRAAIKPGA